MDEQKSEGESIQVERLALQRQQRYDLMLDGYDRGIPVHVLVGTRHRPCLALVAGVHGDEYDGVLTLHQVVREAATWSLEGTLIIVPVANPFAFAGAQRRTPDDDKDLNRVFPGARQGTLTDRLADRLCADVLSGADLVFTLHGATASGILAPWIEFLEGGGTLEQKTREAAEASGFADLVALPRLPGVLLTEMAGLGVPAVEGEVGGLGTTKGENVQYYKGRVKSIAQHIGVLRWSDGQSRCDRAHRIWHLQRINTSVGGIFLRSVELQQRVRTGEVLGTILDRDGKMVAEVRAPVDGLIGGYRVHVGVRSGDRLFTLWCEA